MRKRWKRNNLFAWSAAAAATASIFRGFILVSFQFVLFAVFCLDSSKRKRERGGDVTKFGLVTRVSCLAAETALFTCVCMCVRLFAFLFVILVWVYYGL